MPAFRELYRVLKPDSLCACFYGWPWMDHFMQVWKQVGFRPVSHLTWIKAHSSREGYALLAVIALSVSCKHHLVCGPGMSVAGELQLEK